MKSSYYYPTRAEISNILCHDVGYDELYERRNTALTDKLFEYIGNVPPDMSAFVYEPGLHLIVGDPGAGKSYFLRYMDINGAEDVLQEIGEPLTGIQLKSRYEWNGFIYNLALGRGDCLSAGVTSLNPQMRLVWTTMSCQTNTGDLYYQSNPASPGSDTETVEEAVTYTGQQQFPTLYDYATDLGVSDVLMFRPSALPTLITRPFEFNVVWQVDSLSDLPFVLTEGGYLPGGIPASLYSAFSMINAIAQARRMIVLATFNPTAWTSATKTYFSTNTYASFAGRCLSVLHIQNTGDSRSWSFWGRYVDEERQERRVSAHASGYVDTSSNVGQTKAPPQCFFDVNNVLQNYEEFDEDSEVTEFD